MKKTFLSAILIAIMFTTAEAADRTLSLSAAPDPVEPGGTVRLTCTATGNWKNDRIIKAEITVRDTANHLVMDRQAMTVDGLAATYDLALPTDAAAGVWQFDCEVADGPNKLGAAGQFSVQAPGSGGDGGGDTGGSGGTTDPASAHLSIQSYDGPSTCIACHETEATDMLNSLHMQWAGPTPELSNTDGQTLGKAKAGINTFCTYAMSSKGACFSCHVRADGNAPHAPDVNDVDCLMCHQDAYQRRFVPDPNHTETVTDVYGQTRTYAFGSVDAQGNYLTEPDFAAMPPGTTMVELARTVHMPTRQSCLRCHAKAGGGDWTKRGDMGLSTANPSREEDVHMSPYGADLSCADCHARDGHKIAGRGIDLRQTEAADPACADCHSGVPHANETLNRHAAGQVSCQVCHIRTFAKGGATEMSRDWREPHWNAAFCNGQGGYVGHEAKYANLKPDYTWFDGTSYVYNVGETIAPNADGTYTMAAANGKAFDSKSKIVPIKNHWTVTPLHESGRLVPPVIMRMFMTGDFDQAVTEGMAEQGMTGSYSLVHANAEMLITHGVDPKENAPACGDCHDGTGRSAGMIPFAELGYHEFPGAVENCTLCHDQKNADWQAMHAQHNEGFDCTMCHTAPPTGLVKPTTAELCGTCHNTRSFRDSQRVHERHIKRGYACTDCHTF